MQKGSARFVALSGVVYMQWRKLRTMQR